MCTSGRMPPAFDTIFWFDASIERERLHSAYALARGCLLCSSRTSASASPDLAMTLALSGFSRTIRHKSSAARLLVSAM